MGFFDSKSKTKSTQKNAQVTNDLADSLGVNLTDVTLGAKKGGRIDFNLNVTEIDAGAVQSAFDAIDQAERRAFDTVGGVSSDAIDAVAEIADAAIDTSVDAVSGIASQSIGQVSDTVDQVTGLAGDALLLADQANREALAFADRASRNALDFANTATRSESENTAQQIIKAGKWLALAGLGTFAAVRLFQ